jgi:multidrug efflux pump subunit AcrA (membrane-fusion protein)
MRIGMTASVLFKIQQETPINILPLTALTERNGKTVAFVVDKDTQTVRQREVEAQGVSEDGARIASGLAPGEIVVTGGVQFLQDGMRVRLAKEVLTAAIETQTTEKR